MGVHFFSLTKYTIDIVTIARKIARVFFVVLSVSALLGSGYALGYRMGSRETKNIVISGVSHMESPTADVRSSVDFSTFWQTWDLLNREYLKADKVTDQEKVYGSIDGLVRSLGDPYSSFFNPVDHQKFQEDIQGNFGGIGAELGIRKEQLVVIAPLKDTPAMKAGIKAGDLILRIDATSTEAISIDRAVSLIRGPEGTKVTLTLYRTEWEKPKDITVTRGKIVVPTLDFEMKKDGVAYIAVRSFNENTNQLFFDAIKKAANADTRGIVLDLRDDPGGYLGVAVDLAGWFVPKGTLVVSEESRTERKQEFKAQGTGVLKDIPTVVLINKGSASASEILAGSLRDNRKIFLIGEQSFGKGTVQQLENLKDGSSIKITVAHWVLPSGKILEGNGLVPDIEVKITEEDFKNERDPQLERAIQEVKKQFK